MAYIKGGTTGAIAEIENNLKTQRTTVYPHEVVGAYMARWTTGVLGAALAVNAVLAGIRNGPTANSKNIYIVEIGLMFGVNVAYTATQQFGLYLERYSTANLGGGGTHVPLKLDTSHPNSAATAGGAEGGEVRVSTTAALTTTSVVFSGTPTPIIGWTTKNIDSVVGPVILDLSSGQSQPIKLAPGEGICLRNLVVWPAAGTGVVSGWIKWEERTT